MISGAILYDLLGSKVLASINFTNTEVSDDFLQSIADEYYELIEEDAAKSFISTLISDHAVTVSRVGEVTLIITLSDSDSFSDREVIRIRKLQWLVSEEVKKSSVRDFKDNFAYIAKENLGVKLNICFVTARDLPHEDISGTAVQSLMKQTGGHRETFGRAVSIGPYSVRSLQLYYDEINDDEIIANISDTNIFALIVSGNLSDGDKVEDVVNRIRSICDCKIIVIPGHDGVLEYARNFEFNLGIELCDSVSPKPTHLLLSVLATTGYSDMHPELAKERWAINGDIDSPAEITQEEEKDELGHQAFFVVDKRDGLAIYSYYYEERSRILEIAPNIVAAIASFRIDQRRSADTSVFRTGELSYITIESNQYVYTLITGKDADVERLRDRFSFLPDLFQDEIPETIDDPTDLFRSPLFTLKLLATLPPEELPGRISPVQKRALIWDRFEHQSVRDFLEAVWAKLDGSFTISKLAPGKGPELVLGALHLLKRLDAISFTMKITPDDAPIVLTRPDSETMALYSQLDAILEFVNGTNTIQQIAMAMKMQPSVLVTVFAELHRRGVVTFAE